MRRLLNPLLKLFVNPTPVIHAFKTQVRLNREAATREAERERRQTEWNALHYDVLQRLVTEVSRLSIEMQSAALRVESLSAKVDFNDRRVRSLETTVPPARPQAQPRAEQAPAPPVATTPGETVIADAGATETPAAEGARRKRRRRRGRRSGGSSIEGAAASPAVDAASSDATDEDSSEGDEGEGEDTPATPPVVAGFVEPPVAAPQATAPPPGPAPVPVPAVASEPASEPEPVQPTPPRDEPSPAAPVDHSDPGPPDR